MDAKPAKYAPRDDADIHQLVTRHPFAWVVSGGEPWSATPLPLRLRFDGDGRLTAFVGHFARSNPQVERLRSAPRALLLFMGAHAYISPSWMADRTQAATWNYAGAAFDCALSLIDDAAGIEDALRELIDAMEAGRPNAWSLDDMGERAARLSRGVVAFRADIIEVQAAFKLGQDERDQEYAEIIKGLEDAGEHELVAAMRSQNPQRSWKP